MSTTSRPSVAVSRVDRTATPRVLPTLLRRGLYALIAVGALASFSRFSSYSPLPMTALLDAWVILFVVTSFVRGRLVALVPVLLLAAYLLTRLVPVLYTGAPLSDGLQAYKWVLYLVALAFALGHSWGSTRPLVVVTWFLLALTILKYAATRVIEGSGSRPALLVENNFELALLAGLVAVVFPHMVRRRWIAVAVLGVIVALSGSRSGAISFLLLALYSLSQLRQRHRLAPLLIAYVAPIAAALPLWVFLDRAASSSQVDRLNFLDVFRSETETWTVLNWVFGTAPITPLSPGACHGLSYYQTLFSSAGDGTCYSVILHAFVLRVIFDAGLVGLAIAYGAAWYFMRRGGVRTGLALTLLAIAFANGLSVSGMNNPYVALPMLIAIMAAPEKAAGDRTTRRSAGTADDLTGVEGRSTSVRHQSPLRK
ncbi:hypothetical protein [Serinibacter arcticus]|uniref:hypothetical protein n=1 Tax=Serinibacter arcticus TaxID=1655435 RepID=UPI0010932DFA|nr:hypothetical protein [Serinibacter arcticus]